MDFTIGISERLGFNLDVIVVTKKYHEVVKLVMWLHHGSLKVVKFMKMLYYGGLKRSETSIEASPHVLLHLYEPISGWFHKKDY